MDQHTVATDDHGFDQNVASLAEMFPEQTVDMLVRVLLQNHNSIEQAARVLSELGGGKENEWVRELATAFPEVPLDYLHGFVRSRLASADDKDDRAKMIEEMTLCLLEQLVASEFSQRRSMPCRPRYVRVDGVCSEDGNDRVPSERSSYAEALRAPAPIASPRGRQQRVAQRRFHFDFGCDGVPPESSAAYREQFDLLLGEQRRLLERAHAHYVGKPVRMAASFYSEEAHRLSARMAAIQKMAAYKALLEHNPHLHPHAGAARRAAAGEERRLDLHGLTADEALAVTSAFLQFHRGPTPACGQASNSTCLSIVTGSGQQSEGGRVRLRPAIYHLLKSLEYTFNLESRSVFYVYLDM